MKKPFVRIFIAVVLPFNINAQIITTIAGNGVYGFGGDGGPAILAQLTILSGVAIDGSGNLYIADEANHRIRKVNPAGVISTFAGTGSIGSSGDGGPATSAQLHTPNDVCIDPIGNIYIADESNHKIRKVNSAGIISTFAGTGIQGFSGDGGVATMAQLNTPVAITFDQSGNMLVADILNNRIRKINTSGIISTIVGIGTSGFSGDGGPATSAQLNYPYGITTDLLNNIYVADANNYRIRKINTVGIISTFAGTGLPGSAGDGGSATSALLNSPSEIEFDGSGNMYIADFANNRVRKINTSGIISTFAGTGVAGYSGDGGPATAAKLNTPTGLTFDLSGNLYITDGNGYRVRKVTIVTDVEKTEPNHKDFKVYPDPSSTNIYLLTDKTKLEGADIEVTNYLGQAVIIMPYTNSIDVSNLAQGLYTIKVTSQNKEIYYSKFVKE